jgi:hypothetical protein
MSRLMDVHQRVGLRDSFPRSSGGTSARSRSPSESVIPRDDLDFASQGGSEGLAPTGL